MGLGEPQELDKPGRIPYNFRYLHLCYYHSSGGRMFMLEENRLIIRTDDARGREHALAALRAALIFDECTTDERKAWMRMLRHLAGDDRGC